MENLDFDSIRQSPEYPLAKSVPMDRYQAPHEPTEAQIQAGNYPKRKISWRGLTIAIENEVGSVRCGRKPDGSKWETRMVYAYGYVRQSLGTDGDAVDVFIGPNMDAPFVYVIHQRKVNDWLKYDEDKCMVGFDSLDDAVHAFLANYDDPRFLGPVTTMSAESFAEKVVAANGQMVKSMPDYGQYMLAKADSGAIPPGARWITVHPGEGKGQPVLVMPQSDGSMRVIGGAGGALNHLKLRGVKQGQDYKDAIHQAGQRRREERKARIATEKQTGVYEAKQAERGKIREGIRAQRHAFVQTVAEAMGWDDAKFDEEKHANLSPEAIAKAKKDHEKELFQRAKQAVSANRKMLLQDHDALVASGLGDLPLDSGDDSVIALSDLDPVNAVPGLGFAPAYGQRAMASGLTEKELQAEANQFSGKTPGQEAVASIKSIERRMASDNIAKELDAFKQANPDTVSPSPKILAEAQKAAALIKAEKRLRMAEALARDASKAIDEAKTVEPKAFAVEVSDAAVEEAAAKQMAQDIKTIGAVGLLSEIDHMGGEESLGGHVATGAFNTLNAFATAIGGQPLIDRSVVDVLGINAATQILARKVASQYEADDLERIRMGVEDFHVNTQGELQESAVKTAHGLTEAAEQMDLPDCEDGFDLAAAQAINDKRRKAIAEAKRVLGQATGELQANAALVMALRTPPKDSIQVPMGKVAVTDAIKRLRAIGLKQGQYALEETGGNLIANITGEGIDGLAANVDVEGMAQIRRNLDIISGKNDEDGWLPQGFANRPDLAMKADPGVAQKLAMPFNPEAHNGNLEEALYDYIGGRAADGDAAADILADVQSAEFVAKSGDAMAYRAALDKVAPLTGPDGKMKPIEQFAPLFNQYADAFVAFHYGKKANPLHKQNFAVTEHSVDALHRALSATPEGVAAFKPVGELTARERTGLRNWWQTNVAKQDGNAEQLANELADAEKNEPEKEATDIFGESTVSPEWLAWKSKRDALSDKVKNATLDWPRYVKIMGSVPDAVTAVQDLIRSKVVNDFAQTLNTLDKDHPLKIGKTIIQGNLNHLDAVDPEAREKRLAEHKALVDSLRNRINGKYSGGTVSQKIQAEKEMQAAFQQAQMGFFSATEQDADKPLGADERHTIGHAAEQTLAGMMSVVGRNFQPGKPVKLWNASMSGKFMPQQRAIKLMDANKRIILGYGAGSGKTGIMLGATSHLIKTGKIKRAIHLVPSIVQGQYGGEATRYLEAGQFQWHCAPGASREERIAAYKNPGNHFCVMTHEAFRSDMLHLGAQQAGIDDEAMHGQVEAMDHGQRKQWLADVMKAEGINFDATFVDEAHRTVNREGKMNSSMANVIDALTDNTPYFAYASGDPVKNDASEIHDVLAKMDRSRYADRAAFMRAYGGDTVSARAALKREMARYGISNVIRPDIEATYSNVDVPLSAEQKVALKTVDRLSAKLRQARMTGEVDVESAKQLSPAAFADADKADHKAIAEAVQRSIGIAKEAARKRVIYAHGGDNAMVNEAISRVESHQGAPGVIFAHNRASVQRLVAEFAKRGHRVVSITGADSPDEKEKKKLMFQPESGEPKADIMISSDAGAVGMNLQRGQWMIQYDIPDTAKDHGQRSARIDRIGQNNNINVDTLVADHPMARKALDRLDRKYMLRELMLDPMDGLDDTGMAGWINKRLAGAAEGLVTQS